MPQDDQLEVPHPRWNERPFVIAPLTDLAASITSGTGFSTGSTGRPVSEEETSDSITEDLLQSLKNPVHSWNVSDKRGTPLFCVKQTLTFEV